MPNWCTNELRITGKNAMKFFEANKGKVTEYTLSASELQFYTQEEIAQNKAYHGFTFNALVPVPEEILKQGYNDAGYSWQTANWGTKWDINDKDIDCTDPTDEEIIIYFDTAWSPPEAWLKKAAQGWTDLSLELNYYEPGVMFCGHLVVEDGDITMEYTYGETDPEFWEFLYDEFNVTKEDLGYEDEEEKSE